MAGSLTDDSLEVECFLFQIIELGSAGGAIETTKMCSVDINQPEQLPCIPAVTVLVFLVTVNTLRL